MILLFVQCKECSKSFIRIVNHVIKTHKMSYRDYVIKHEYAGIAPLCGCGCGQIPTFRKGKFKRYVHCHASNDPVLRQEMINAGKAAAADPEKRKKNSEAVKRRWQDSDYREMMANPEFHARRAIESRKSTTTPEFSEKMRQIKLQLWKDEEWAEKQREKFSSEEFSELVSKATTEALSGTEIREKMSSIAKKGFADGKRTPKSNWSNINAGWHIDPHTKILTWFDSGWEFEFAELCHKHGVVAIRKNDLILPYTFDGVVSNYFPDFVLPEHKLIIEIKGQESERDLAKYEAGEKYAVENGMGYIVIRLFNERRFNVFLQLLKEAA